MARSKHFNWLNVKYLNLLKAQYAYPVAKENMLKTLKDYSKGLLAFKQAPAPKIIITIDFEFYVPVRFDTDQLSLSFDSYSIHSWNNIPLIELKIS